MVVLAVSADEWQVFTLLVFEADLPPVEKFRPRMNVGQLLVLVRSFELSAYHIFETVVGDDVVVCTLVFDGNRLFH